jgi:hypothetical protein
MARSHIAALLLLLLALVIALPGCGNRTRKGTGPDTRTPAQYFKETQGATVTPHGKIKTDTVEGKNGKIHYQTEDGKTWSVGYTKRADGTYQYGMPEEVKGR